MEKEYALGGGTGDYACTTCGFSLPRNDKDFPKNARLQ